jgi:hypothetical protein
VGSAWDRRGREREGVGGGWEINLRVDLTMVLMCIGIFCVMHIYYIYA